MNTVITPAPLRDMLPPAEPLPDRLPPMLFLAAVFHAIVILGVTFDPGLDFGPTESTTLDVVIVASPDQSIQSPEDAAYLAQASQEGDGNTRDRLAASAAPLGLTTDAELTEMLGDVPLESEYAEQLHDTYVMTTAATPDKLLSQEETSEERIETESPPASLPQGSTEALPLPTDAQSESGIYDENPRELVFSVDTQKSDLAAYLASWKSRVEQIGSAYYNREIAGRDFVGSPTIKVAIRANGDLAEIVVTRSSGDAKTDQAALSVLRRAAPYDPIPPHLREDYDMLRFEYKFEFRRMRGGP